MLANPVEVKIKRTRSTSGLASNAHFEAIFQKRSVRNVRGSPASPLRLLRKGNYMSDSGLQLKLPPLGERSRAASAAFTDV